MPEKGEDRSSKLFTLFHCTNYEGFNLNAEKAREDKDFGEQKALFFQVCPGHYNAKPSDPRQGRWHCAFGPNAIGEWLGEKSKWNLYFIKEEDGNNERHVFYKYALVEANHEFNKQLSKKKEFPDCKKVFSNAKGSDVWEKLEGPAFDCFDLDNEDRKTFNHMHLGVVGFEEDLHVGFRTAAKGKGKGKKGKGKGKGKKGKGKGKGKKDGDDKKKSTKSDKDDDKPKKSKGKGKKGKGKRKDSEE